MKNSEHKKKYTEYDEEFKYNSKNLNYIYNIEYYRDINFLEPEGVNNEGIIKVHNKALTNFEVAEKMRMKALGNEIAPHCLRLKTVYPGLLVGVGQPHSFGGKGEAALGISLDYVTGMPYIPGSSVKGMLRSAFRHADYIRTLMDKPELNVEKLEMSIFGRGHEKNVEEEEVSVHDIFFDAIIESDGRVLDSDNITPHRQNKELMELAAPNPITMFRIPENVEFCFQFRLHDSCIDGVEISADEKLKLFKNILTELGIGAKTNVGYGSLEEGVTVAKGVCKICGKETKPKRDGSGYHEYCSSCKNKLDSQRQKENSKLERKLNPAGRKKKRK